MSAERVLIIGATSAIAEATARQYAARGARLYLVGRDIQRVEANADDLRIRGAAAVHTDRLDASDYAAHAGVIERVMHVLGGVDVALIAHGTLPDESRCRADADYASQQFAINADATLALSGRVALGLEAQGSGTLAVISSVAGDRGRASNYLYGSAKAAVTAYVSGLRQYLHGHGVNVLTIKPGLVDTPMTAAFRKGLVWAQPERIAHGIVKAVDRRRSVVYLPWFWRPIMLGVRCMPEAVFRRIRF